MHFPLNSLTRKQQPTHECIVLALWIWSQGDFREWWGLWQTRGHQPPWRREYIAVMQKGGCSITRGSSFSFLELLGLWTFICKLSLKSWPLFNKNLRRKRRVRRRERKSNKVGISSRIVYLAPWPPVLIALLPSLVASAASQKSAHTFYSHFNNPRLFSSPQAWGISAALLTQ